MDLEIGHDSMNDAILVRRGMRWEGEGRWEIFDGDRERINQALLRNHQLYFFQQSEFGMFLVRQVVSRAEMLIRITIY